MPRQDPATPTPNRRALRRALCLLAIVLLAWGGLRAMAAGGGDDKKPADAHGEPVKAKDGHGAKGEAEAEARPSYKLGPELDGHYDYHVLREMRRVSELRYPMEKMVVSTSLVPSRPSELHIQLVVEFGRESGLAELDKNLVIHNEDLRLVIERFDIRELLTHRGKQRLKEAMVATLNRRLTTASVREIYFTEFRVMFG